MTMPFGAPFFAPTPATLAAVAGAVTPAATPAGDVSPAAVPALAHLVPPVLVLLLCVVAGVGTVLLLPGRRDGAVRKVGGAVLLAAGIVFGAVVFRAAAGRAEPGAHLFFWPFAAVGLFAAVRLVTHPKPVYSALYFVLATFASAGLFVLVWAEFMAAALILIYAGAILVTYVFVIMLATQATAADGSGATAAVNEYDTVSREPVVAAAIGFAMMAVLVLVITDQATPVTRVPEGGAVAGHVARNESTQAIGRHLFEHHLVNLEVAGLLLTLATVGAIVIARRPGLLPAAADPVGRFDDAAVGETVTAPMTPTDDDPHSIPVYGTDNPRQKAYPET